MYSNYVVNKIKIKFFYKFDAICKLLKSNVTLGKYVNY